jgi:hypothetical protein
MARRKAAIPLLVTLWTVAVAGVPPTLQAPNAVRSLDKATLSPVSGEAAGCARMQCPSNASCIETGPLFTGSQSELAYVVTPENVGQILRSVATPNKEVVFTTLVFNSNLSGIDMVQVSAAAPCCVEMLFSGCVGASLRASPVATGRLTGAPWTGAARLLADRSLRSAGPGGGAPPWELLPIMPLLMGGPLSAQPPSPPHCNNGWNSGLVLRRPAGGADG